MNSGDFIGLVAILSIFVFLPWMIFHYVTKWKTAATLTNDDERMFDEMNALSRRLEERLETVERLTSQQNPEWTPRRLSKDDRDKFITQEDNQFEGRN